MEQNKKNQCTNRQCNWVGNDDEKSTKRIDENVTDNVCPKCGNDNFFKIESNMIGISKSFEINFI